MRNICKYEWLNIAIIYLYLSLYELKGLLWIEVDSYPNQINAHTNYAIKQNT